MTVLADPYGAQRGTVSGAASVVAPGQRNQSAPEFVRYLTSKGGRHKVLFGSNFPMIAPQQALAGLDALGLDDETRALSSPATRGASSHSEPPRDGDGVADGAEDRDHDGVDNDNEIAEGTSPRSADTDHDRRRDGDEDADRDGLDNEAEDAAGDDPRDRDTDGDGIEDGDEQSAVVVRSVAWTLRLKLAGGRSTSGRVNADTVVSCSVTALPP